MANTSIRPTSYHNLPRRQEICNCSCPLPNLAYYTEKLVRQATLRTVQLEVVLLDGNVADPDRKTNRKTAIPITNPFEAPLLNTKLFPGKPSKDSLIFSLTFSLEVIVRSVRMLLQGEEYTHDKFLYIFFYS
jgi:hypothetical protein